MLLLFCCCGLNVNMWSVKESVFIYFSSFLFFFPSFNCSGGGSTPSRGHRSKRLNKLSAQLWLTLQNEIFFVRIVVCNAINKHKH